MNKKECIQGILFLKKAIPKIEIDEQVAYFMLKHLTNKQFQKSIKDIILDRDFKLYQNIIAEINYRAFDDNRINGEKAWDEVLRELKSSGYYGNPKFNNNIIKKAIELNGGWKYFCTSKEVEMHWIKKRFITTLLEIQENNIELEYKKDIEDDRIKKLTTII